MNSFLAKPSFCCNPIRKVVSLLPTNFTFLGWAKVSTNDLPQLCSNSLHGVCVEKLEGGSDPGHQCVHVLLDREVVGLDDGMDLGQGSMFYCFMIQSMITY